jgi:hypothetical protein
MTAQPKLNVPNPAAWVGRIWDRMPASNGEASLRAWTRIFGLKDQDPRVLEAVGCFLDMANKTEEAVHALRGLPESVKNRMLGWTPAFNDIVLQTAANGAWSNIRLGFTDVRREQLQHCEEWLDQQMWTWQETRSYLDSLLGDIEAMKTNVECAELDEDFRGLLLDILEALRRAVAEYEIRGSKGVFSSLGEVLALRTRYVVSGELDEVKQGFLERTWALTKKVAAVGSTGVALAKAYQLGRDVFGLLAGH